MRLNGGSTNRYSKTKFAFPILSDPVRWNNTLRNPEQICKSEINFGLAFFASEPKRSEREATVKVQNEGLNLSDGAIADICKSTAWQISR
jgi:hypothetical protein